MAATIAAAAATTSQIVPFGKCISSTIPTAKPAAMTTTPASTMPIRARRALTSTPSSDERRQHGPHSIDVGGLDGLRRYQLRFHVSCPRPPRDVVGREEHGRPHAQRRGEMADP